MEQVNSIKPETQFLDISKPHRLVFNSTEEASNYVRKMVEYFNNRITIHSRSFGVSYIEGKIYIIFDSIIIYRSIKYDLIFASVPPKSSRFSSFSPCVGD